MAQAALRRIVFSLATTGLLMGCVEGAGQGSGAEGASDGAAKPQPGLFAPGKTRKGGDVEAPEVFQVTDTALWDGRPSLGGIWVASPDVKDPERVIMVNAANGKSVTGALFRRERDNPGPALQISSDAAEALGILAGQPVEIRVTALRREEPEPVDAPPAEAVADTAAEAGAEAGADPSAEADAAATAAAATAALAATDGAAGATTEILAPGDGAVVATEDPPKRKTWKERRAEAKAAREAKKAAAAAAAAGVAGTEGDGTVSAEVPATVEAAGVAAIETAPLDTGNADAAVVADPGAEASPEAATTNEPPKTRRQKKAEAAAAQAAAEAEAAAVAEAATAGAAPTEPAPAATGRPIQVASFSKEENASRAVQALAKIGVSAEVRKSEVSGKAVWGVVAFGDAAMLASIKGAGFADAYFLK